MLYYVAFCFLGVALALLGLDFFGAIRGAGGFANLPLLAALLLIGTQAALESRRRHHLHHSH